MASHKNIMSSRNGTGFWALNRYGGVGRGRWKVRVMGHIRGAFQFSTAVTFTSQRWTDTPPPKIWLDVESNGTTCPSKRIWSFLLTQSKAFWGQQVWDGLRELGRTAGLGVYGAWGGAGGGSPTHGGSCGFESPLAPREVAHGPSDWQSNPQIGVRICIA